MDGDAGGFRGGRVAKRKREEDEEVGKGDEEGNLLDFFHSGLRRTSICSKPAASSMFLIDW